MRSGRGQTGPDYGQLHWSLQKYAGTYSSTFPGSTDVLRRLLRGLESLGVILVLGVRVRGGAV